jgi:hypothetical protein
MKINDLGKVNLWYIGLYDGNTPPKWQTLGARQTEVHTDVEPKQAATATGVDWRELCLHGSKQWKNINSAVSVRFGVVTEGLIKIHIFSGVLPCRLASIWGRFESITILRNVGNYFHDSSFGEDAFNPCFLTDQITLLTTLKLNWLNTSLNIPSLYRF